MDRLAIDGACYQNAKLIIKHTFVEFECLPEDDACTLKRHRSAPVLTCAALATSSEIASKCAEIAATPTSCISMSCDEDDVGGESSFASSPCGAAEKEADKVTDGKTTLMVRNIPHDLSQLALVQYFIEQGYGGLFDLVYMPMNFRGHGNFGYAFINFRSHAIALQVMAEMRSFECDDSPGSRKFDGVWSTCQGLRANVERYRNSPLMHELVPSECKPAMYDHIGNQIPFPKPTKKSVSKPRIHLQGYKDGSSTPDLKFDACFRGASSGCHGQCGTPPIPSHRHRRGRKKHHSQ